MATPEECQQVHHSVLRYFMEHGRAPHYTELATTLGVDPETACRLVHETTEESPFSFGWMTPDTDYIAAWAEDVQNSVETRGSPELVVYAAWA